MSKATRTKLKRLAMKMQGQQVRATVVTFSDTRGSASSIERAKKRALKIQKYLRSAGLEGSLTVRVEASLNKTQGKGVLILIEPAPSEESLDPAGVTSLIVRLAKGRAASDNGVVIGADRLSSDLRSSLSVGAYLGLRMYRLDFAKPVDVATANAVARALTLDPGVVFAEPDAQVSIAANS